MKKHQGLFFRISMETREQARQAAAKAAGQELLDENVKKAQVIQAKTKFNATKTKMRSATNQIKTALEEFKELKEADPSDKEAAALLIQSSWERLLSGTTELQKATDNLAEVLGNTDPTILEDDIQVQIENEKQRLIDEWTTYRKANKDDINAARAMVENSNTSEETQPVKESKIVQRRFTPDQTLKPKMLDESSNLLEVKDFIIEFTNYIKSG